MAEPSAGSRQSAAASTTRRRSEGTPSKSTKSATPPARSEAGPELEHELDRLSLEQALRDFEIANARVIDLTQRLITANERITELQRACDETTTSLVEAQTQLAALTEAAAYRIAGKIWAVRNLVRR